MSAAESTRQQLDPAGTFGEYRVTGLLAIFAVVWAVSWSVAMQSSVTQPSLVLLAVLAIGVAAIWLLRAAHPLMAPFTGTSATVVFSLAAVSSVLSAAAAWGDGIEGDDWIPVAVCAVTISMTPYRPARELTWGFCAVTLVLGVIQLIQLPWASRTGVDGPGFGLVVASLAPTIVVSICAIQYSKYLVDGLYHWQRRADVAAASLASAMATNAANSIEREHLAILSRDVVPFFSSLLERGTVTDADRQQAREIATSMRDVMVEDANRTWLTIALDHTSRDRNFLTVVDAEFSASAMDSRQRTVMRAMLIAMAEDVRILGVSIRIDTREEQHSVTLEVTMDDGSQPAAAGYDTYFSVLRVVFDAFRVDIERQVMIARFGYGRT